MNNSSSVDSQLQDTRRAFDSVAADYDGPLGNNALIQRMRGAMWRTLGRLFVPGSRLLDLGCGTGIDAVYLAARGYEIVAADWSPQMVERTRARVAESGPEGSRRRRSDRHPRIGPLAWASVRWHLFRSRPAELRAGPGSGVRHVCGPAQVAGGKLVVSAMGRRCPWEWVYYAARGDLVRARLRSAATLCR